MGTAARGGLIVRVNTDIDLQIAVFFVHHWVCLPAASSHKPLVKRRAENSTLHHDSFRYIVIVSVAHSVPPFQKREDICTTHSPMKAGRSPGAPAPRASASTRMHGVHLGDRERSEERRVGKECR